MKVKKTIIGIFFLSILFTSCVDDILKKPIGSDLPVDSVFSTKQKALGAIATAYSYSLIAGITTNGWDHNRTWGMRSGTMGLFSGELCAIRHSYEDGWMIAHGGMTADDGTGIPLSDDSFLANYVAIRHNYLVIENIDKVQDMSNAEKLQVKAEMATLIAYRYSEMFKRYGGVPIVTQSLNSIDDIIIPRSNLYEVLQHIITLCDEAVVDLPDSYPKEMHGRATKGVALAVKAEALMFAARPLFNSATPYLDLGENNDLICFGQHDMSRWDDAIKANEAVIKWAETSGTNYIINTGSPLDDYGTAVATPSNPEVLIAYKAQYSSDADGNKYYPLGPSGGANAMSFNQLSQYSKADGTAQVWPNVDELLPYSDYYKKIMEMEPRYKASASGAGLDAWNNPNDDFWNARALTYGSTWEGIGNGEGCGRRVKFWYKAGRRDWFEFPVYRLAEFYLNLAEAYNEINNSTESLKNLNIIRKRGGVPEITETDQEKLREIIQKEWAVEFYEEAHRLYDVKHWKHKDIGNGIIGGPHYTFRFTYKNGEYAFEPKDYIDYTIKEMYNGFWNPNQYLSPFPVTEVNKGYLIQNPGY
ncbi:MAG: RagB/SusD family nutrient uptake outer membrane protein [Fermentimonas sp.]|jgi:hypothetical protein